MDKSGLTQKEKDFCKIYFETRNGREAAARAGYKLLLEKTALKLLSQKEIKEELERLFTEQKQIADEVKTGYRRLAFGSVTDAVKLILLDGEIQNENIEEYDLFCVSDIKRAKGGGVEIKFFDRLKALEHLEQLNGEDSKNTALPFYEALEMGAKAVNKKKREEN